MTSKSCTTAKLRILRSPFPFSGLLEVKIWFLRSPSPVDYSRLSPFDYSRLRWNFSYLRFTMKLLLLPSSLGERWVSTFGNFLFSHVRWASSVVKRRVLTSIWWKVTGEMGWCYQGRTLVFWKFSWIRNVRHIDKSDCLLNSL